jgi:hypothetical protein
MKAADKFDPDNGARFGTYATWWIRHAILRALCNQARLIRLPVHAVARMARIRQVFARMTEQLGREPTQEEIADETGLKLKQIAAIQAVIIRRGCARASGGAQASHVWNAFQRNAAGRDALPLDPRQQVRWSCPVYRLG